MSLADIQLFIKGDPVMGAFFVICAVVMGLGFLALPVALVWGLSKSGRNTMYFSAFYLLTQGGAAYKAFPDRGGLYLAAGFALAAIVVFLIARFQPAADPRRSPEDTEREQNRRILHTFSGKFIALLTAGTCLYVAWMFHSAPGRADSAGMALGFFLAGLAGVYALLFPAQATALFEVIGSLLPDRRRY